MNSYMTIMVRVVANQAQARIEALRRGLGGLDDQVIASNRQTPLGQRHISSLMRFGNQLQWTGRMLQYNFSLPLAVAAAAATKWSMEQEAAFVHVAKVYGDTQTAARQFRREMGLGQRAAEQLAESYRTEELEALDEAFTALSNHYGVQKKEVLEVAGAWAAAGASGRDLAESVNQTMQAIIIGDMQAMDATKALISIQAQYNLSTKELQATLANLNSIENQTGASMSDLITGFEKAAGVARSAGIETQQLAAYMAALVPATGSAATAGNALKTVISRLMSPTKEASQVMQAMGLETTAMSWQSATATERLQIMAKEFSGLGKSAQNAAASVIASRWQVNRFEVLMRELINTNGYYVKALKASEDQGASFRRMQEELNTVLESDPRALQRMFVMLQNAMVDIIQPLIPFILYLADSVADAATAFSELNPNVQKLIIFGLALLAVVGPLVRYMGALATLFGVLSVGASRSIGVFTGLGRVIASMTFMPLLKGMTVFMTWLGGTTGLIAAQGSMWKQLYMGFLGFFSRWTAAVAKIFTAGAVLNAKIWATGLWAKVAVTRAWAAVHLAAFGVFWAQLKLIWLTATLTMTSRWAAMWAVLRGITLAGWASIPMTGPMGKIKGFLMVWTSALATIWVGLFGKLAAIGAAGWTLLRTQWVVHGILYTSLWNTLTGAALIGTRRIATIQTLWAVTMGAIFSKLRAYLTIMWGITMARLKVISLTYQLGELTRFGAFMAAMKVLMMTGALSIVSTVGAMWTAISTLFKLGFAKIFVMFAAAKTYMTLTWAITLTRLKVLSLMYQLGEVGRWTAMWTAIKMVSMAGALTMASTLGAMWKAIRMVTMAGALGVAAVSGVLWRTLALGSTAAAGSVVGVFAKMRAALVAIWLTTAAASTTIFKGLALTMVMFSRAGVKGVINVYKMLIPLMMKFGRILLGPWGILISAVVGILYAFKDQIAQIWRNIMGMVTDSGGSITDVFYGIRDGIMSAFASLPQGVQNVMVAIVTIIRDAALAVYDWFQYINPWAHHSPSLVDNVTTGMAAVQKQFAGLSNIKGHVSAAYAEVKRFGKLTAQLGVSAAAAEQAENKATLKKAGAGQALGSYSRLIGLLNQLTPQLAALEGRMNSQQRAVDAWQAKVDAANRKLDTQQKILDRLRGVMDGYKAKLDAANESLSQFASTPLKGMQAMSDKMHENRMAQTRLRFEMMKMSQTFGTYDELKSKIDSINGAQELLRGTQADLRSAGAGSEILSAYDAEMAKLDQQKDKYAETADKLAGMQAKLDALQVAAERLDLVKAMRFDDLEYQIQKAANTMEEMSFEQIMSGIKGANAEIAKYSPMVDKASAAVANQQAVVDRLTSARDKLQSGLDREQNKLDAIRSKYDEVNGAIQAINSSMSDVIGNADKMNQAMSAKKDAAAAKRASGGDEYISPGLQNFLDAGKADFPDPGGRGIPPRSDWTSQAADIEKFTEQLGADTASMFEDLNPFKPLKAKAVEVWNWIKGRGVEILGSIGDSIGNIFAGVSVGNSLDGITGTFGSIGSFITGVLKDIGKMVKLLWDLVGPDIINIGQGIWEGIKGIWDRVGPELAKFGDLFKPLGEAIQNVWTVLKPVLAVIVGAFAGLAKVALSVVGEVIGPMLKSIGDALAGAIRVIRGFAQIVIGILTGDLGMIWQGVKDIFTGLLKSIWAILSGGAQLIWNIVKGIVKGIWGFFVWLLDILVGHSVIPDLVNAIVWWFGKLKDLVGWVWNNVAQPLWGVFKTVFGLIIGGIKLWWAGVKLAFGLLVEAAGWIWDNVLQPVWGAFKAVWDDYIVPFLSNWWAGMKIIWSALTLAGKWIWNNVLEPVWKAFKKVWDDFIKPFMARWWRGIQNIWSPLKKAGSWFWENVLKPVWEKVKDLWARVGPELKDWWARIQKVWNALKAAAGWIWREVLSPVFGKVKDLWTNVKASLGFWWEGIKKVWSGLTTAGSWVKREVMDPIFKTIKDVWGSIKSWLSDNKDMLLSPMKGIVNIMIGAVNTIIKGLNKVADILPGIDWNIEIIPKLATGGNIPSRKVGGGFKTNGARAIVGEGKANYPEFVIPTDPTYRRRARGLMAMAASKIGMGTHGGTRSDVRHAASVNPSGSNGVPEFGIGGILSSAWEKAKGAKKAVSNLGRMAVGKVMDPLLNSARSMIKDKAPWTPLQSPPLFAIDKLEGWVKGADKSVNEGIKKYSTPVGGNVSVPPVPNGSGRVVWKGGTFTNQFVAHMRKAEKLAGSSVSVMQGGFRPATSYSGTSHQGDAVDFQVNNSLIRAFRRVGIAAGDRTGLGDWAPHTHAIPGPGAGSAAGSAVWQWQDYIARGGMNQPLNSSWGLANGGIVKARRGGVGVRIGEGEHDEAVVPLPKDWRNNLSGIGSNGGETVININGDLVLPNISSGDDAQEFIDNLKVLARG